MRSPYRPGQVVTVDGEQVTVVEVALDGWVRVRYPDGDLVWTPPAAIEETKS